MGGSLVVDGWNVISAMRAKTRRVLTNVLVHTNIGGDLERNEDVALYEIDNL